MNMILQVRPHHVRFLLYVAFFDSEKEKERIIENRHGHKDDNVYLPSFVGENREKMKYLLDQITPDTLIEIVPSQDFICQHCQVLPRMEDSCIGSDKSYHLFPGTEVGGHYTLRELMKNAIDGYDKKAS